MAAKDKLVYFDLYGRAEPIRMLYAIGGEDLDDVRIKFDDWPQLKSEQPLGALPVLTTSDGMFCQSNTIARLVAKKFGMVGETLHEEALHDLVLESCKDFAEAIAKKVYVWKLREAEPEPEDSEKLLSDLKEQVVKTLKYIQSLAEKQGKKYIVGDTIGLAEVWLYTDLDFIRLAFPDSKELTPWIKDFVTKMEEDERIEQYIANRPASAVGV